jgi:hypothetical protein
MAVWLRQGEQPYQKSTVKRWFQRVAAVLGRKNDSGRRPARATLAAFASSPIERHSAHFPGGLRPRLRGRLGKVLVQETGFIVNGGRQAVS